MDTHKEAANYNKWQNYHYQPENEGLQVDRGNEGPQPVPHKGDSYDIHSPRKGPRGTILGLAIPVFWCIITVLVLLLAGGIGAGIGVGLSNKSATTASCQTSPTPATGGAASQTSISSTISSSSLSITSKTSSSTTSAPTGGPSPIISTPCISDPSTSDELLSARDATGKVTAAFTLQCNTNYPAGSAYGNPNTIDLLTLWVPDMAACINACAAYNAGFAVAQASDPTPKCMVVAVVRQLGEKCYLKSATGRNDTSSSGGVPIDSAVLVPS